MRTTQRAIQSPAHSQPQSVPRFKDAHGQIEDTGILVDEFGKLYFTEQGFRLSDGAGKQKVLASTELGDVYWQYAPVHLNQAGNNRTAVTRVFEHFNSSALKNENDVANAGYIHIHTGIFLNQESAMFRFHVQGYAYGNSEIVDIIYAGYSYAVSQSLHGVKVSQRAQTSNITDVGLYKRQSDSELILRFTTANTYYLTFAIDSMVVGNGHVFSDSQFSLEFHSAIELA